MTMFISKACPEWMVLQLICDRPSMKPTIGGLRQFIFILWSLLVSPMCPTNDSVPRQNFFGWCKSTILSSICIYNSALVDNGDKVSFARCQPDANIWGILSSCSAVPRISFGNKISFTLH
jgi:hypothetical protein